jgi:hypothetical protein
MTRIFCLCLLLCLAPAAPAALYITIIQGLDGTPGYGEQFRDQAQKLNAAAESVTDKKLVRLYTGAEATREAILAHFANLDKSLKTDDRLALLMVGHGSYDGFEYKFNIPGPDLTDADVAAMLDGVAARVQLVVNTSSASGVLQDVLKKDSRIVITATRNGSERLATRFGGYFADAFVDPAADVNKNNAVSVQEAFDYAERQVKDYFEFAGQLATEHPVLTGDQASQLVLARTGISTRLDNVDPVLAALIGRREEIDTRIQDLQLRKSELPAEEYLDQLQILMIDLSVVQEQIDQHNAAGTRE